MANEWAHKMLDEIRPDFYGEITFTVRAGEIRKAAKVETHIAPDIKGQCGERLIPCRHPGPNCAESKTKS
jgi:hypothetical protein